MSPEFLFFIGALYLAFEVFATAQIIINAGQNWHTMVTIENKVSQSCFIHFSYNFTLNISLIIDRQSTEGSERG